jgi:PKD repeat protein
VARYCRAGAALAVLVVVCALAPAASAVVVHSASGRFFGVTPHSGIAASAIPGAMTPTDSAALSGPAATPSASWENLNYQGGPVLHSSAPYVIFWTPSGETMPADWQPLIQRYFTDVAADSTRATNVYAVNRQFTDQTGFADYRQTFDPSTQVITDTHAYPTPRDAANCGASTYTTCLTDTQLQAEVSNLIDADGLPTDGASSAGNLPDAAPIYFIVLPSDVDVCFSDGSGTCASNYFCAYHSAFVSGSDNVLYAAIPTLALDNAQDAKACQSDGNPAVQQPNGSLGDVALKYISHEDSETITDPLGTGWWSDYTGNEDGDNCNDSGTDANAFLPTLGGDAASGTLYNQSINGNHYYLQSEWSNGDGGCEMQPSSGTITPRFAVPPGPRAPGTPLTFDPTLSSSSNRISSETWDFGDGTAPVFYAGRTLTAASHTYTAAGDYTVTLTLVDNRGNLSQTSEQITVGGSPTAAFTFSPSQPQADGGTVAFDATSSTGAIVSYSWDFGDGTAAASGPTPSHAYANGGTYLVRLTVTVSGGQVDTMTSSITVADEPPTAGFTIGESAPEAGQTVLFDGTSSADPDGTISAYAWNFGDGVHASGATPTHRYAAPGTYTVTLTVTDSGGQHASASQPVTVAPGPSAAFVTSPSSPTEGVAVAFDGTGSSIGGSGTAITSYAWSFGDGTLGTGPTPSHTYATAGSYRVRLTVTDGAGASSSVSHWVSVADEPPTATFMIPSGLLLASQPLQFDASASSDPDGSIASYTWQFGDGTAPVTGATPTHAYASAGTYSVQLTVVDRNGQSATVTKTVAVHALPQSLMTFSPALPLADAPVSFTGAGSLETDAAASIAAYQWDFGDGGSATGIAPSHTYATAGTYTVTLTVTDGNGLSDSSSEQVTVASGSPSVSIGVLAPPAGGRAIAFTGSSSALLNGIIVSYVWSFGDGSTAVGRVAKHTYTKPGRYVVTLRVTDSSGASTVTTRTVTVRPPSHVTRVAVRPARAGGILQVSVDVAGTVIAGRDVVRLRHPGTARIPVELSAAQQRAVRRGARLRVHLGLTFVPVRGPRTHSNPVITFRRAPGAPGHIAAALAA